MSDNTLFEPSKAIADAAHVDDTGYQAMYQKSLMTQKDSVRASKILTGSHLIPLSVKSITTSQMCLSNGIKMAR